MTPKEKAKELVEKIYKLDNRAWYDVAKQCALISVDETLKAAFYSNDEIYNFYIEVKQEIEKL